MSDVPVVYRERLDERTILEKIDRKRAETQRLQQETQTFVVEQRKMMAEATKLERDRFFTPWLALVGRIGGSSACPPPLRDGKAQVDEMVTIPGG